LPHICPAFGTKASIGPETAGSLKRWVEFGRLSLALPATGPQKMDLSATCALLRWRPPCPPPPNPTDPRPPQTPLRRLSTHRRSTPRTPNTMRFRTRVEKPPHPRNYCIFTLRSPADSAAVRAPVRRQCQLVQTSTPNGLTDHPPHWAKGGWGLRPPPPPPTPLTSPPPHPENPSLLCSGWAPHTRWPSFRQPHMNPFPDTNAGPHHAPPPRPHVEIDRRGSAERLATIPHSTHLRSRSSSYFFLPSLPHPTTSPPHPRNPPPGRRGKNRQEKTK